MLTNQHVSTVFPASFHTTLEALAVALLGIAKRVRARREAVLRQRCVAELAPHLRYDVGDIDLIPPPPRPLREIQRSRQQSLEAMWLRHF